MVWQYKCYYTVQQSCSTLMNKAYGVDYSYVQEKALVNQLVVQFVPSFDQKAYI